MRLVKRKWGHYLTLLDYGKFKVKILRFKERQSCSYQFHSYRNELWLFLSGGGRFLLDGETSLINKGDFKIVSTRGKHRFTAAKITYVLEIQFGEKCDENDITRI